MPYSIKPGDETKPIEERTIIKTINVQQEEFFSVRALRAELETVNSQLEGITNRKARLENAITQALNFLNNQ